MAWNQLNVPTWSYKDLDHDETVPLPGVPIVDALRSLVVSYQAELRSLRQQLRSNEDNKRTHIDIWNLQGGMAGATEDEIEEFMETLDRFDEQKNLIKEEIREVQKEIVRFKLSGSVRQTKRRITKQRTTKRKTKKRDFRQTTTKSKKRRRGK